MTVGTVLSVTLFAIEFKDGSNGAVLFISLGSALNAVLSGALIRHGLAGSKPKN